MRKNSHEHLSEISRKLKRPQTTVFEAEKKLIRKEIITRYYTSIDFETAGFSIRTGFMMDSEEKKIDNLLEKLSKNIHVNNLQILNGSANLFVEAIFKNIRQFLKFNEQLKGTKNVFYITEELKTEGVLN